LKKGKAQSIKPSTSNEEDLNFQRVVTILEKKKDKRSMG